MAHVPLARFRWHARSRAPGSGRPPCVSGPAPGPGRGNDRTPGGELWGLAETGMSAKTKKSGGRRCGRRVVWLWIRFTVREKRNETWPRGETSVAVKSTRPVAAPGPPPEYSPSPPALPPGRRRPGRCVCVSAAVRPYVMSV